MEIKFNKMIVFLFLFLLFCCVFVNANYGVCAKHQTTVGNPQELNLEVFSVGNYEFVESAGDSAVTVIDQRDILPEVCALAFNPGSNNHDDDTYTLSLKRESETYRKASSNSRIGYNLFRIDRDYAYGDRDFTYFSNPWEEGYTPEVTKDMYVSFDAHETFCEHCSAEFTGVFHPGCDGTAWDISDSANNPNGNKNCCCGDDIDDFGKVVDGYMCIRDLDGNVKWKSAETTDVSLVDIEQTGLDLQYLEDSDSMALPLGDEFLVCSDFGTETNPQAYNVNYQLDCDKGNCQILISEPMKKTIYCFSKDRKKEISFWQRFLNIIGVDSEKEFICSDTLSVTSQELDLIQSSNTCQIRDEEFSQDSANNCQGIVEMIMKDNELWITNSDFNKKYLDASGTIDVEMSKDIVSLGCDNQDSGLKCIDLDTQYIKQRPSGNYNSYLCTDNKVMKRFNDADESFFEMEASPRDNMFFECSAGNFILQEETVEENSPLYTQVSASGGNTLPQDSTDPYGAVLVRGVPHFCSSNGEFIGDLDKDPVICREVGESYDILNSSFRGIGNVDEYLYDIDKTGNMCCGDDFIEYHYGLSDDKYEFYQDTRFGDKICWNNRVVSGDNTIDKDPEGNDVNLILNPNFDYLMMNGYKTGIKSWKNNVYDPYTDGFDLNNPFLNTLRNAFENYFVSVDGKLRMIFDKSRNNLYMVSRLPINFVKALKYELKIRYNSQDYESDIEPDIYLIEKDAEDSVIKNSQEIVINHVSREKISGEVIDTYEIIPKENIELKIKISADYSVSGSVSHKNLDIYSIELRPKPSVLNTGGQMFKCKEKNIYKTKLFTEDTNVDDDKNIFSMNNANIIEFCSESLANKRCSPEGVWVDATDDDEDELDYVSVSPNIIEDSDFDSGYKLASKFNLDKCEFKLGGNLFGDTSEIFDNGLDGTTEPANLGIGKNFVRCSFEDISLDENYGMISFNDSDGSSLDTEKEYIFSAYITGNAALEFANSQGIPKNKKTVSSTNWQRVEVHGKTNEQGVVEIKYKGNFDIDGLQLEEKYPKQFERTKYFRTTQRRACCNSDKECWNGHECVDISKSNDNTYDPYSHKQITLGEYQLLNPNFMLNNDEYGYLCLGSGSYEYVTKAYRWIEDSDDVPNNWYGFCKPDECFVGRPYEGEDDYFRTKGLIDRFTQEGVNTACMADGQEFYGKICDNGVWRNRLAYLTSYLKKVAEENGQAYSLYCSDFEDVLNYYSYQELSELLGRSSNYLVDASYSNAPGPEIDIVDKACVLRYAGGRQEAIGLLLNLDNNAYDGDLSMEAQANLMRYFGVDDDACSSADNGQNKLIRCGNSRLYKNSKYGFLIYDVANAHNGEPKSAESLDDVEHKAIIENLKNFFKSLFNEKSDLVNDWKYPFETEYNVSLHQEYQYGDIFIFDNNEKYIYATRDKIIDKTKIGINPYKFIFKVNMSFFNMNQNFLKKYEVEISPVDLNRSPVFIDVFNISNENKQISYAFNVSLNTQNTDDDYLAVVGVNNAPTSYLYKNWYAFTGKLRGDVRLPQKE